MGFSTLPTGYVECQKCGAASRVSADRTLSCGCPSTRPSTVDAPQMFGGGKAPHRTDESPVALRETGSVWRPWAIQIDQPSDPSGKTTPILNANARMHHQRRGAIVKRWRRAAYDACAAAQLPRLDFATIGLLIRPPDRQRRDAANLMPTQKPIVDGVVDAGVVDDDSTDHVLELVPKLWTPTGRKGVWQIVLIIADGRRGISPDDLLR